MSRNVRYKPTKSPPLGRKSARKGRTIVDSSSESDYDGVDLVSDSDGDEEDVSAAEEQAMLQLSESESEEDDDDTATAASQPLEDMSAHDMHDSWEGFGFDMENGHTAAQYFGDAITFEDYTPSGAVYQDEKPSRRHVHWDCSDSDSSLDSQVHDDMFPDLFVEQDRLDPQFRKDIEVGNDDPYVSDEGSFIGWDLSQENNGLAQQAASNEVESQDGTSSEDYSSSSGYESAGETTDEDVDIPPVTKIVDTKAVLRRTSTDSSSLSELDEAELVKLAPRPRNPYARRGPVLATWFADPTRPYAFVDEAKKKIVVIKGRPSRHLGTPSRPNTALASEFSMEESPMISNSGNMMLSAMYQMNGLTGGQAVGPPEAFYPFVSINADGSQSQDGSSYDEEDDEGHAWDLGDIFDFGEDAEDSSPQNDDEEDDISEGNVTEGNTTDIPSTPARPRRGTDALTSEDQIHPLLEHFDRNPVGAFRRNQHRHALITRNSASKDSLAFTGPYGAPIRGIKHDRMAAANAPITPARRAKMPRTAALISPSPAASASNKRKASNSDAGGKGYKRNRSIN